MRLSKCYDDIRPEGGDIVFNKNLFRAKCVEKGVTLEQVAGIIGVNQSTLYRKMNGKSDFTRNEIQLFRSEMGLSCDDVQNIFFAEKLA